MSGSSTPASQFSTMSSTGIRVPFSTGRPRCTPGFTSTSGQSDQSIMISSSCSNSSPVCGPKIGGTLETASSPKGRRVNCGASARAIDYDGAAIVFAVLQGVLSHIQILGSEDLRYDFISFWQKEGRDRKSTRLNSSHLGISYA